MLPVESNCWDNMVLNSVTDKDKDGNIVMSIWSKIKVFTAFDDDTDDDDSFIQMKGVHCPAHPPAWRLITH